MALTKKQREKLRMKFGGRCAYCGCELPEKGWHADHVQAVLRKSEQCMKAAEKGIFRLKTTSLEMFRKQVSLQVERGRRSSVNFRTAERFGLISVVNKPVVFWFEQYEGENK
ncbi:HNH endonuclease [Salmonella enterica]|nr:HNH endonuclease [Salmonella enterica]EAB6033247.1 HNH endonuclease [Salmonella enterica subsp. enterica serovar Java]EBI0041161.1 HNH endonuclease [Salmonella enterica subsp. diarizonae serovar 61:k:z35]ECD9254304.1 HNH endonuclease [Salmonella enterica subsp. diarizonae]ECT8549832.1 HNH endonuclease [Salmonella enterica subsp. diarizonae serovar 48:i:z]EIC4421517.1 HNH endonuclease [Salmonella enterica subsp. enterica serovar Cerro]